MRQAGRFLPEYRAIRERLGFLELCRTPDVAADLSLAEEPAGFVAVLEAGAPAGEAAPGPSQPGRG